MAYPAQLVIPMKEELTTQGFNDLHSVESVNEFVNKPGTALVVVNSVCGCAAGNARPGAKLAMQHCAKTPDAAGTVFAGFDLEATQAVRQFLMPYPPSSPSMGLFKDGELVFFLPRESIEGSTAQQVAMALDTAFQQHC